MSPAVQYIRSRHFMTAARRSYQEGLISGVEKRGDQIPKKSDLVVAERQAFLLRSLLDGDEITQVFLFDQGYIHIHPSVQWHSPGAKPGGY